MSTLWRATLLAGLTLLACDKKDSATTPEPVAASGDAGASAEAASGPVEGASEVGASQEEGSDESASADEGASEDEGASDDEGASEDEAGSADAGGEGGEVAAPTGAQAKGEVALELPAPLFRGAREGCGGAAGVGQRVKNFKLATPEGKTVSPSYYRGRVVLLNFWGTWCKPCLQELPEFSRLYRRYRKYGLTLVAVATDEDAEKVQAFLDEKKIAAKVGLGGEATAGAYGDRNFPFTFVIDSGGVIRAAYDGYKEGCLGALEADIRDALEKRNRR